jgi:hypothetical protein
VKGLLFRGFIGGINVAKWNEPCIAFPIYGEDGKVFRAHCRRWKTKEWVYEPSSDPQTRQISALVYGDFKTATKIYVFESQWDAVTLIDILELFDEIDTGQVCLVATRGAQKCGCLKSFTWTRKNTTIYAFAQNDDAGHQWLNNAIEIIGGAYVVPTPLAHNDLGEWVKDGRATAYDVETIIEHAEVRRDANPGPNGKEDSPPKNKLPLIDGGADIQVSEIVEPPLIIEGILHKGLKMEIAGASKSMKSWLSLQMALCIATGHEFLGRKVAKSGAFFLNLEVPKWHFDSRVQVMTQELGVTLKRGMFKSWSLRGVDLSRDDMWNSATEQIAQIKDLGITITDPLYKLCNEKRGENDQGAMTSLMKRFDVLGEQTGASTSFNHHYAKGSPNSKDPLDRFSGSGVLVRGPDVYIAMTRHAEDNAIVLELTLRCLKQIEPFVVRWNYPLFELAPDLKPEELRKPHGTPFETVYGTDVIVEALGNKTLKIAALKKLVLDATGMSRSTFYRLKNEADIAGLIVYDGQTDTWERCGKR